MLMLEVWSLLQKASGALLMDVRAVTVIFSLGI
jgi:hypothetical protein